MWVGEGPAAGPEESVPGPIIYNAFQIQSSFGAIPFLIGDSYKDHRNIAIDWSTAEICGYENLLM